MSPPRRPLLLAAAATTGVLLLTPVGLSLVGDDASADARPALAVTAPPAQAGIADAADEQAAAARGARADAPSRSDVRETPGPEALVAVAERRAAALAEVDERVAAEAERLDAEAEEAAEARAAAEEAAGYDLDETDPKVIARQLAGNRYGWDDDRQWGCIDELITQESSWNPRAVNPSSGAYGLVQSLPAEKMASAGDDWRTNPATQLEWGFGYIEERYGTPCDAWSFHLANNWY